MKKLFVILFLSLFFVFNFYAQDIEDEEINQIKILTFKHKCEAKRVQRRFNRAVIYKEIVITEWNDKEKVIYIEIEDDDYDEYYNRLGIKFMCIPKRHFWDYTEYTLYLFNSSDKDLLINNDIKIDQIL